MNIKITFYYFCRRRVAGVVERGGLENRCAFAGTKGSNPLPSAFARRSLVTDKIKVGFLFIFVVLVISQLRAPTDLSAFILTEPQKP